MKKIKLIILLVCVTLLCGCTGGEYLQNNLHAVPLRTISDFSVKNNLKRAEKIKNKLLAMDNIDDLTVVVTGKTALIGIYTNVKDQNKVIDIKDKASALAMIVDPKIINTAVTANEKISNMIKELEEKQKARE